MDAAATIRELATISDRLSEAVHMLHCLKPQCVDLVSEGGVDVGVVLGAIESNLTQQHARLSGVVYGELCREPGESEPVRTIGRTAFSS